MIGEGMTLYCHNTNVPEESLDLAKSILSCMGRVEHLDESLMAEVTALTGSSPAYVFMMIEAMGDAAVLSGIRRDLAYKLAAQAILGSAGMVLETGEHPGKLKDQVCSPGGTTIEAVRVLEMNGFRSTLIEAMQACTEKARQIAGSFLHTDRE
jgi:pyrroline-5-carboxylate reductase